MTTIQERVLNFVRQHDLNPTNQKTEKIHTKEITPELAQEFSNKILNSLDPKKFHEANAIFFEFVPPSQRERLLVEIQRSCNTSVLCANFNHPPSILEKKFAEGETGRKQDARILKELEQTKNLDAIPSITKENYPDIHACFEWLITQTRNQGDPLFANRLEELLKSGKLKYLPDFKRASAYADPRDPVTVIFGKEFFEKTWGDRTRGLGPEPLIANDQDVEDYVEFILSTDKKKITIDTNFRKEVGNYIKPFLALEYGRYFGNLPSNTFSPNMPMWIIMIPHEIYHTLQISQDRRDWKPNWTKGKLMKGLAYYTTLMHYSNKIKFNNPQEGLYLGKMNRMNSEGEVLSRMSTIQETREQTATNFGIAIARKIHQNWPAKK